MKTLYRRSMLSFVVAGSAWLCACDEAEPRKREELEAAATAALGGPDEAELAAKAAEEARLTEIYARKEKEAAEATAAVAATLDKIAVVPEKLPKSLDAACDEMIMAYDEYQRRTVNDDKLVLEWVDHKRAHLGVRRVKCEAVGSIEAAACQTNGLNAAPDDFKQHGLEILTTCVNKYAPDKLAELQARAVEADHAVFK